MEVCMALFSSPPSPHCPSEKWNENGTWRPPRTRQGHTLTCRGFRLQHVDVALPHQASDWPHCTGTESSYTSSLFSININTFLFMLIPENAQSASFLLHSPTQYCSSGAKTCLWVLETAWVRVLVTALCRNHGTRGKVSPCAWHSCQFSLKGVILFTTPPHCTTAAIMGCAVKCQSLEHWSPWDEELLTLTILSRVLPGVVIKNIGLEGPAGPWVGSSAFVGSC